MIAAVAVSMRARLVDRLFDYVVPAHLSVTVGQRVEVPFGPRRVEGYVLELRDEADSSDALRELREICRVLDEDRPTLLPELVALIRFIRERYMCTWGAAIQVVLPPITRTREERKFALATDSKWDADLPTGVIAYVRQHGMISEDTLRKRFSIQPTELRNWLAKGVFIPLQQVVPRLKHKRIRFVSLSSTRKAEGTIRGEKQKRVMEALFTAGKPVLMTDLIKHLGVGVGVISGLEKKGQLIIREEVDHTVALSNSPLEARHLLTGEQAQAVSSICLAIDQASATFLLRGVTGSGKTEVYLQAIEHALKQSRTAIMLVPEIALTAQMTERFRRRFGGRVAVLHSRLTDREKFEEWHRIRSGQADVVIGARSAIFAPLANLGLIVVDEEHETTYKQENDPRYLVREVAHFRATENRAALVLGSATPSLESMYRAELGRYHLLSLSKRIGERPLANVEIVDMREELKKGNRSLFSRSLHEALQEALRRKEQSILFLNRRGFASFLLCRDCGAVATCPYCDISLTLHRGRKSVLRCHFCGHAEDVRESCASCGSARIRQFGAGTQRIEHELLQQFEGMRVIRMDVDTTRQKGAHERLINEFERGEADVLLGTQMIAKGLDFSRVSLVGVVAADTSLHVPDFRAAERTFQLLVQVAGRAGRHEVPGRTIVQTFAPEHYAVQAAALQDYESFYEMELKARRSMEYPPFTEITQYTVMHRDDKTAWQHAQWLHEDLVKDLEKTDGVRVLAAVPAPVARLKELFRYHVVVKYKSFAAARPNLLASYEKAAARAKNEVVVHIDVNAHSLS